VDAVADPVGVGRGGGLLGVSVLDQLVVLGTEEGQLRLPPLAIEDAELELLVAHHGGAVGASLDMNAGPGVELVGDLIDERSGIGHATIVPVPA
jgi:hypothetical protein